MSFMLLIIDYIEETWCLVSNAGRVLLRNVTKGLVGERLSGGAHCLTWTSNLRHDDIRSNDIIPKIRKKTKFYRRYSVIIFMCTTYSSNIKVGVGDKSNFSKTIIFSIIFLKISRTIMLTRVPLNH